MKLKIFLLTIFLATIIWSGLILTEVIDFFIGGSIFIFVVGFSFIFFMVTEVQDQNGF